MTWATHVLQWHLNRGQRHREVKRIPKKCLSSDCRLDVYKRQGLAGVSPVEVFKYCFYPFLLLLASIITIHFGLMRTKEEKEAMAADKAAAKAAN